MVSCEISQNLHKSFKFRNSLINAVQRPKSIPAQLRIQFAAIDPDSVFIDIIFMQNFHINHIYFIMYRPYALPRANSIMGPTPAQVTSKSIYS